jgi:hypothetical protein
LNVVSAFDFFHADIEFKPIKVCELCELRCL